MNFDESTEKENLFSGNAWWRRTLRKGGEGGVVMGKKIKDVIGQWRIFNQ